MRGKVLSGFPAVEFYGITPAYAGKSIYHVRQRRSAKDHPRLCGEKRQSLIWRLLETGSPPPMRGKD